MTLTKKIQYVFASSFLKVTHDKKSAPNIAVTLAFKSKYPKARYVCWYQIDVFKWQVNFSQQNNDFSALFDSGGLWLETHSLLQLEHSPIQVQSRFKENYNPNGIQQILHIKTLSNDIFEIQWSNGVFVWKLLYDSSGKIVGKLIV